MFSLIFEERRRRIALVLILPAIGANVCIYALPPGARLLSEDGPEAK